MASMQQSGGCFIGHIHRPVMMNAGPLVGALVPFPRPPAAGRTTFSALQRVAEGGATRVMERSLQTFSISHGIRCRSLPLFLPAEGSTLDLIHWEMYRVACASLRRWGSGCLFNPRNVGVCAHLNICRRWRPGHFLPPADGILVILGSN